MSRPQSGAPPGRNAAAPGPSIPGARDQGAGDGPGHPGDRVAPDRGPGSVDNTTVSKVNVTLVSKVLDTTDRSAQQERPLMRRRRAAARLPALPNGVVDPLANEHANWQDQHDVRMARAGLAPAWQRARARELWRAGVR